MKPYTYLLAITLLFASATVSAQQNKVDDALLLDMYQSQHYIEAAAYLKATYIEPITDNKVLSRLGYTFLMAGKLTDAEGYYQRLYKADSTNVPTLFSLAGINFQRGNNDQALIYYQQITTLDKTNFRAYKRVGELYLGKKDTLNALKNYTIANRLNPEDPEVASSLGYILGDLKRIKTAEMVLNRALAADTTSIFLLRCLTSVTFKAEQYPETIKACSQLLNLDYRTDFVFDMLGSSYYMLKNYDCCTEYLASVGIKTERTLYFMAESYKALKKYRKAIDFFEQTLVEAISPYSNKYYSEMADSYDELHQLKSAVANYQKSLFFKDKDMIFYALANLYDTKLNDKKNALKYYKKYLDTKPPELQKAYIDYVQNRILWLQKK